MWGSCHLEPNPTVVRLGASRPSADAPSTGSEGTLLSSQLNSVIGRRRAVQRSRCFGWRIGDLRGTSIVGGSGGTGTSDTQAIAAFLSALGGNPHGYVRFCDKRSPESVAIANFSRRRHWKML